MEDYRKIEVVKQLIWYDYVQRMEDTRLPNKIMQWVPINRRKLRRLRKT